MFRIFHNWIERLWCHYSFFWTYAFVDLANFIVRTSFFEQLVSRKNHQTRGLQPADDRYYSSFPLIQQKLFIICDSIVHSFTRNKLWASKCIYQSRLLSLHLSCSPLSVGQVCSFLVRPSDNTPGDYSLFFRTNENIQRFKISPTPTNQYMMGGRYYNRYDWQLACFVVTPEWREQTGAMKL